MKAIEVQVEGDRNEDLIFTPLQTRIRCAFNFLKIAEASGKVQASEWPGPIPGQHLGIDPDGTGYVSEPLHELEHAAIKERITSKGMEIPPAVRSWDNVDVATWLF